jgi:hypothetical protein
LPPHRSHAVSVGAGGRDRAIIDQRVAAAIGGHAVIEGAGCGDRRACGIGGSVFPLVFPSIAAPRLLPPPPPPVSDSVPAFVMVLLLSTLRRGNGTIVECTALTDAPGATLMVTPVLPVAAITGVVLAPEQVTVVPLVGAVLVH